MRDRPPVRWGLVLLLVLVGIVALGRGLQWYFDPLRQADRATAAGPASPASFIQPAEAPLPNPTREEIALLRSSNVANQKLGADTLLTRAITPEVMAAVDAALERTPAPEVESRLVCLKARFEGPAALEFLASRFPTDPRDLGSGMKPEVSCLLAALVARAAEAPELIRDTLMPATYSASLSVRNAALRAFRTLDLPDIPASIVAEAATPGARFRHEALAAALALGAIRRNPELVAVAVRDANTRPLVRQDLSSDPHPNAAHIVANAWAERSFERELADMAREREGRTHDVSAALLEILRDKDAPELKRKSAAEALGALGEVGPLHALRELAPSLESQTLKLVVDRTIRTLAEQMKAGRRDQMRALPR